MRFHSLSLSLSLSFSVSSPLVSVHVIVFLPLVLRLVVLLARPRSVLTSLTRQRSESIDFFLFACISRCMPTHTFVANTGNVHKYIGSKIGHTEHLLRHMSKEMPVRFEVRLRFPLLNEEP